jgi:hypothetical protein
MYLFLIHFYEIIVYDPIKKTKCIFEGGSSVSDNFGNHQAD